jgi:hypothetical protein
MARAKTPRTPKVKTDKKVLQMPDTSGTNGNTNHSSADVEGEIRVRAYELFEQRGYVHGMDREDWFQAEREILERQSSQKQTA